MYSKLLKQTFTQHTSVQYWETKLGVGQRGIDWRKVLLIPRISKIESYTDWILSVQNLKQCTISEQKIV